MSNRHLFTSESVTEGHPDKICDQISDAILDAILTQDPNARVAAECSTATGLVLITGEITTTSHVDVNELARQVIEDIGYVGERGGGFDARTCAVLTSLGKQSPDIAGGVDNALEKRGESKDKLDEIGAGDQGLMFGYACDETPEFMPMPISLAHRIARRLSEVRKNGTLKYLRPDGKTQVTVEYHGNKPVRIDSILISTQHDPSIDGITDNAKIQERIASDLKAYVINQALQGISLQPDERTRYYINPSGRFVIGGPQGDAGLTGRKIIVDTYGGYARHGGGAFSGKDPTKVDRSAAYAARYVAKNIVASGLASRCEVQIAYAIGVARPVSINVTTFGTGKIDDERINEIVKEKFDLRPAAIIKTFNLNNLPKLNNGKFYRNVAAYGHFGRVDLNLPWEKTDRADELKALLPATAAAQTAKV